MFMKNIFCFLAIAFMMIFSFTACDNSDEEDIEVIDEYTYLDNAIGSYSVTLTDFDEMLTNQISETQTTTAKVVRDNDKLKFEMNGDVYYLSDFALAGNGFYYDVSDVNINNLKLNGFKMFELTLTDGTTAKRHGTYAISDKWLVFYMQATIDGVTVIKEYNCKKK